MVNAEPFLVIPAIEDTDVPIGIVKIPELWLMELPAGILVLSILITLVDAAEVSTLATVWAGK